MPAQPQLQEFVDTLKRHDLLEPPAELWQFATEETIRQQVGHERRRFRRYSLITNVIAVPLDEELRPAGSPFVALSSGMSVDGMRLLHTQAATSSKLFLEIDGQPVRFVLSVLRSRPIGTCFEIAGRLTSISVLDQRLSVPTVQTDRPSHEELLHWAGVSAAVTLLKRPDMQSDADWSR